MMFPISNKWRATRGQEGFTTLPSFAFPYLTSSRTRIRTVKVCSANMAVYNSKKANLIAAKKERMKLPFTEHGYHISEFLRHPFGIQATLNADSLESFQSLDANTYRCILPKVELLNFETAPVLDLRVTPTEEGCTVEMISCKFQGSELVERQNDHFSDLHTALHLLPTSAVESAGNLVKQALLDRLVPLLLDELLQD